MAYLDEFVRFSETFQPPKNYGNLAAASFFPIYETLTPQYPYPTPYNLAIEGYRKNDLIYACINARAESLAEAELKWYDKTQEIKEELEDYPGKELLKRPNPAMVEEEFWRVSSIYADIAGFCIWEIEFSNAQEPIGLWPMRPDWCSFMRGNQQPLRAVRYQPYGLPYVDVPIERTLVFQYFDPIYPMLKGLSPTAIAMRLAGVDNSATDFVKIFFDRGLVANGILKTDQTLNEHAAEFIKKEILAKHGGFGNWGERSESRICSVFHVPPIVAITKMGIEHGTYSNYEQQRKAFYEETTSKRWKWFASQVREQLDQHYGNLPKKYSVKFDTSDVVALQEEKNTVWTRVDSAAKTGIISRNQASEELGKDPVDYDENGEPQHVYLNVTVREQVHSATPEDIIGGEEAPDATPDQQAPANQTPAEQIQKPVGKPKAKQLAAGKKPPEEKSMKVMQESVIESGGFWAMGAGGARKCPQCGAMNKANGRLVCKKCGYGADVTEEAKSAERRQFRAFAEYRIKAKMPEKIAEFNFNYLDEFEQAALIGEYQIQEPQPITREAQPSEKGLPFHIPYP